jgi:glycosyltransferase involved in cell wall biosynthesis
LAGIYNLAEALFHPSLLPGTELPPFEAMSCGKLVVTSLDETVADAGILIDPRSAAEIGAAMRRVWESPGLAQGFAEKALARGRIFTWERTARETLAAYREICG